MFLKENLLFDILGVKVNSLMSCNNQGDIDLSCDNQGDIDLSKNPTKHSKAKHIDIRYHFDRECHEKRVLDHKYVPSNDNL